MRRCPAQRPQSFSLVCKQRKYEADQDTLTIRGAGAPAVFKAWDHGIVPHEVVLGLRGLVHRNEASESSQEACPLDGAD